MNLPAETKNMSKTCLRLSDSKCFLGWWWPIFLLVALGFLLVACGPEEEEISSAEGPHFTNVAAEVGLDFEHGAFRWDVSGDPVAMMGGGLCWLDYDQDGWLDLFVVNSYAVAEAGRWEQEAGGLPTSALYHNEGGTFTNVSEPTGAALPLRGNGCVAADLNLDGWPDLYVTTSRVNMLLWNNGDGTFTEGAAAAGVDAYGWQTAAAVGDVNGDTWPDLFVAGYVDLNNRLPEATMGFPNTHRGVRDLLFLNQGPDALGLTTFREVGVVAGLENADYEYGLGALFTDVEGDGDLDLYVANDTNPNRLYENIPWPAGRFSDPFQLGFRFREIGLAAGVDDPNSGMGIAGGDYNLDGRPDLLVTNLGDQLHGIYRNQSTSSRVHFADAHAEIGLPGLGVGWTGWGTSWADFDQDSDLDLFVVNGNVPVTDPAKDGQLPHLYRNLTAQGQEGQFGFWTTGSGLDALGPRIGRGGAVADYDNDGDMDIAFTEIGRPLVLLRNDGATGNWLMVDLAGFHPGAQVTVKLGDGTILHREIHAGSSYHASEDPRGHFGLGAHTDAAELIIRWPDGRETRLQGVPANQMIRIVPDG
jgi:hypothetical protein